MPHHPPAFWPEFNDRTGLYAVHDDRGPVLGFEDIETFGDAESHALDLIAQAQADAAALDDFEAAAVIECVAGFDALLAEAA